LIGRQPRHVPAKHPGVHTRARMSCLSRPWSAGTPPRPPPCKV
jgi:hypothetical protein